MVISICKLNIKINNRYEFVKRLCKDYLISDNSNYDFEVTVSEQEIEKERIDSNINDVGLLESTCALRQIGYYMLNYNAILIHSSVLSLDNEAYGFLAPSGTGKSTHTRLWMKYFENRDIKIINGDKPIYRYFDNHLFACGNPWGGKEGYNSNCIVKVKAFCFLKQGKENKIRKLNKDEVVNQIFKQILMPKNIDQTDKTFSILNLIIDDIPFYLLECNISLDAVKVAYEKMKGEDNEN